MTKYRIKKIGYPEGVGKISHRYHVQYKLSWWFFWITYTTKDSYESARSMVRDFIAVGKTKQTVQCIYHTEKEPEHLPQEQIDRFHEVANKKELEE